MAVKERVIGTDPMARFKHVFRAELDRQSVIVAGVTELQAAEEAAAYFGISQDSFRENGTLNQPTAKDIKAYGRQTGKTAEMLVVHPRYGEAVVTAICREDAIMQAAALLEAPISEMFSEKTEVRFSGRVKYYTED